MQLLLETARADEVREAAEWRVIDGVMTDPALMADENADKTELVLELLELVGGPVFVEVTAGETASMIEEARALSGLADRVVVRIPCIAAGIPAIAALADERLPVDASLCFSVSQALLAAKAGARFLTPPVGAVDEAGGDGLTLVSSILTMLDQYDFKANVIVSATDNAQHVSEAARMGADGAAISLPLLRRLVDHPLTDAHRRAHLERWRRAQH